MPSQLNPGQVSDTIRRLRDKALADADRMAPDTGYHPPAERVFDRRIKADPKEVDLDYPKNVPQTQSLWNRHVGNGEGGPV